MNDSQFLHLSLRQKKQLGIKSLEKRCGDRTKAAIHGAIERDVERVLITPVSSDERQERNYETGLRSN